MYGRLNVSVICHNLNGCVCTHIPFPKGPDWYSVYDIRACTFPIDDGVPLRREDGAYPKRVTSPADFLSEC